MMLLRRKAGILERLYRRVSDTEAFSLIEILVATALFLVVTTGVASTMILGLRSTVHTRLTEMGKAAAQQQIEEMRARVFYVPYSADPDVGTTANGDLLDRYYPNLGTDHVTDDLGWEGWYTDNGGDAYYTMQSPPDDNSISLTVETRFVDSEGNVVIPPGTYDSDSPTGDYPPSDLVQVTVVSSWLNRGDENSYPIVTNISATDQSATGGSEDAGGEAGCQNSSNSNMDISGGTVSVSTGTSEPYEALIDGTIGNANATTSYDCTSNVLAYGTGGEWVIAGGNTYTGAFATVAGPPADSDNSGPTDREVTSSWPHISIMHSKADVSVNSNDDTGELNSDSAVKLDDMTVQLEQVAGTPGGYVSHYLRWDITNPTVELVGSGDGCGGDDDGCGGDDDSSGYSHSGSSSVGVTAALAQQDGVTEATSGIDLDQVDFLPLEAITSHTPSAEQGLVFIRDFQVDTSSQASEADGSASNSLTYSATVGMFNTSKSSYCSGDSCYDLYQISPDNPIQTVIDLGNSDYKLQNAILTEFESFSDADIDAAMYSSDDGSTAMISVDAIIKISADFGTEVRLKTNGQRDVSLIDQQGILQLWLGIFDISVVQNV